VDLYRRFLDDDLQYSCAYFTAEDMGLEAAQAAKKRHLAARRGEIAELYDERFRRMWEFYLCVSESAFRRYGHSVFQLQLAKKLDAVPITRGLGLESSARSSDPRGQDAAADPV
jgi:cyclopropane fatty-acyl-phospholipid synthase-like methyltransferase